jgi:hypothetical protein
VIDPHYFPQPAVEDKDVMRAESQADSRRDWELNEPWYSEDVEQTYAEFCESMAADGYAQVFHPIYGRCWIKQ